MGFRAFGGRSTADQGQDQGQGQGQGRAGRAQAGCRAQGAGAGHRGQGRVPRFPGSRKLAACSSSQRHRQHSSQYISNTQREDHHFSRDHKIDDHRDADDGLTNQLHNHTIGALITRRGFCVYFL